MIRMLEYVFLLGIDTLIRKGCASSAMDNSIWTQSEGVIISLHATESNDFASSQPIPGPLENAAFQRILVLGPELVH